MTSLGKVAYRTKIKDEFQGVNKRMENFLVMGLAAISLSALVSRYGFVLLRVEQVISDRDHSCISSRYQKRNLPLTGME